MLLKFSPDTEILKIKFCSIQMWKEENAIEQIKKKLKINNQSKTPKELEQCPK